MSTRITLSLIGLTLLTSCASVPIEQLAPPVDDLFLSEARVSASEIDSLREGRKIYTTFCTDCHAARQVDKITTRNWEEHIPKMFKKAELYPEEIELVTYYIKTAAAINQQLIAKRPQ
jgi:cytochrome c5